MEVSSYLSEDMDLAKPKSHNFTTLFDDIKIFCGFMSL